MRSVEPGRARRMVAAYGLALAWVLLGAALYAVQILSFVADRV